MYIVYQPPYFLFVAGLLASLASGIAFNAVLQESTRDWNQHRSSRYLAHLRGPQLLIPFAGIAFGSCLFLASGMQIFGFPARFAYAVALPLTIFTGWLVWYQLGKILNQIVEGGSKALDLDSF